MNETKSTHRADVVRIEAIEKHPNADTLGIVKLWNFVVCVRLTDWKVGDLAVYIQPDSVVPDTPQFAFLGGKRRIKTRRLRGVYSQGLLMPAPEGSSVGDDVAPLLGITRYEPPIQNVSTSGADATPPDGEYPVYDVESWHRYGSLFKEGEEVIATEKIHGTNARYVCVNGEIHCGSRTRWIRQDAGKSAWWQALLNCPGLELWLRANEGYCVYGEVFGPVQNLKYGRTQPDFRAFDIRTPDGRWLNYEEMVEIGRNGDLKHSGYLIFVPTLFKGPYNADYLRALAEGQTTLDADHIREGIVIRPVKERYDYEVGRVQLKIVSDAYLEKDN